MKVGSYEVEAEIGRGGMGIVYKAHAPDGRAVAIKVVRDKDAANTLARFERERRLLTELVEDDGFVPLIEAGACEDGPYLVMPLLGEGTLRERLGRPWTIRETVALGRTLARALGRAHARGIVHRDLKPENILFTTDGRPLVTDLGLAKHFKRDGAQSTVALTQVGHMVGTAGYMAPEQLVNAKDAGPRADVFALGLILHECLTGRPAFSGKNPADLLANIAECNIPSLRVLRPDAPEAVLAVVETALAASPDLRWKDGDALAAALPVDAKDAPASSSYATTLAVLAILAGLALLAVTGQRAGPEGKAGGGAGERGADFAAPVTSALSTTPR